MREMRLLRGKGGSLKSQSESMAELGPEARLPPPMHHIYTCTTVRTACLHNYVSCQDLEKYQFCNSQDLTRELEEWKQVNLSSVGPGSVISILPLPPLLSCWPQGQGQRSWSRWKVGPCNAQGTGQEAIGHWSQPSNPPASLGGKNKPHWRATGDAHSRSKSSHSRGRSSHLRKMVHSRKLCSYLTKIPADREEQERCSIS